MANHLVFTHIVVWSLLVICEGLQVDDALFQQLVDRIEVVEKNNLELERKNGILEQKNSMLEEKVSKLKAEMNGRLSAIEQEHIAMKDSNGEPNMNKKRFVLANEGPIAFTAGISPVQDHMDAGQVIKFETIITDIGGAYNSNSGIFVAPITGVYMFSCSLLDSNARSDGTGVMLHAEIVQGHTVLGRIFAHAEGSSYRDQGAQTVFAKVTKGEQVWVRIWDSTDLSVGGELYSTFSGYLLWPMENE